MNIKSIIYLASALALLGVTPSCEKNDIYEKLDFAVRLAPGNSYLAGEPVVFEFEGNADFINVWNGDLGHEYQYRNRTLSPDEFISSELQIEMSQQYGNAGLDIYITDKFEGLRGRTYGNTNAAAAADRALIQQIIDTDFAEWDKFAYDVKTDGKFYTFTTNITAYKENFSVAIRIKTPAGNKQSRTYAINPQLVTEFNRYGSYTWKYGQLGFIPFRMEGLWTNQTPYVSSIKEDFDTFLKVNQNGLVKFSDGVNPLPNAAIGFQSFTPGTAVNTKDLPGVTYEAVDQWIIMQPFKLYSINKDTGASIKGVTDDVKQYEYTYTKPGTYTATFIVSKGNFQGESAREVREVTFTIIDPIR